MPKFQREKERNAILEFIQLYHDLPALWNVKSKEYHNRERKNSAYERLLGKFQEMYPDATKDDVKKKINCLRTNFRKELRKYLRSLKSGPDIYEPTLWYYKELIFLQEHEDASDSRSSIDVESTPNTNIVKDNDDESMECSTFPAPNPQPLTSNPIPKTTKFDSTGKSSKDNKKDDYHHWAMAIAADLQQMEQTQQIYAKKAIAEIIMEGRLGLLHRNSVTINEPPLPFQYSDHEDYSNSLNEIKRE